MRGILINPFDMTITEVQTDALLTDMYRLLHCDDINAVRLPHPDVLWVDGEGLFKKRQKYFRIPFHPQPLAGYGLVLGVDREGENMGASVSVRTLRHHVDWIDVEVAGTDMTTKEDVDTQFGKATVIKQGTYFRDIPTGKVYSGDDAKAKYTKREPEDPPPSTSA